MSKHLPHQKCPPGSKEQVRSTDSKEAVVREACISLEEAINLEVVEVAVVVTELVVVVTPVVDCFFVVSFVACFFL